MNKRGRERPASEFPIYTGCTFSNEKIRKIQSQLPKPGGYKWLQQYLDNLDPYEDWEQILRTESHYGHNLFFGSLAHSTQFMNVIQNPLGSQQLKVTGKVFTSHFGHSRNMDANGFVYSMMLDGITTPEGTATIERLNRLHTRLWQKNLEPFTEAEDYIMAILNFYVYQQRLSHVLGLPPMPEYRKIAYLQWGRHLWTKILGPEGTFRLDELPQTWDGVEKYVANFNNRGWPKTQEGHDAAEALIAHFCWMWFPRPLWFIGRQLVLMVADDTTVDCHQVGPRRPWVGMLIKVGIKVIMLCKALVKNQLTA